MEKPSRVKYPAHFSRRHRRRTMANEIIFSKSEIDELWMAVGDAIRDKIWHGDDKMSICKMQLLLNAYFKIENCRAKMSKGEENNG